MKLKAKHVVLMWALLQVAAINTVVKGKFSDWISKYVYLMHPISIQKSSVIVSIAT